MYVLAICMCFTSFNTVALKNAYEKNPTAFDGHVRRLTEPLEKADIGMATLLMQIIDLIAGNNAQVIQLKK